MKDLSTKPADYFGLVRPEMFPFIPARSKRIVEFGCGEGNFSAHLAKESGAEVWGVELEEGPSLVAAKKLYKVIHSDALKSLDQLPDDYFDVAVFNDVLEHLNDPYQMLSGLHRKMAPGGCVVASIPNIRFFRSFFDFVFRGNWDYQENGIMDKTHVRFFTKKSIPKMFEEAGYGISTLQGINRSKSLKPVIASVLTFGAWSDIAYLQFAVVAPAKK